MASDFLTYMKTVENAALMQGGATQHTSPEGGTDTWGYGHKLQVGENLQGQDPDAVLTQDIQAYEQRLKKKVPNYDALPQRSKEMLVDFEFNLGDVQKVFPSFYKAVMKGDIEEQRKEYKRYFTDPKGKTKEVKDRNERFFDRYLSSEALKGWAKPNGT